MTSVLPQEQQGYQTKSVPPLDQQQTVLPNEFSTATRTTTEEKDEDEEDNTDFIWLPSMLFFLRQC